MLTTEEVTAIEHLVRAYHVPRDKVLPTIHKAMSRYYTINFHPTAERYAGLTCQCFGAGSPDPCPIHDGVLEDLEDDMPDEVDGAR